MSNLMVLSVYFKGALSTLLVLQPTDQRVDQRIIFLGNINIMPCAEGIIIIMPWLRGNVRYVAL